jgi:hypothetical protein
MNCEEIIEEEWLTFASENDCFDFLSDASEDIYSKEDGICIRLFKMK